VVKRELPDASLQGFCSHEAVQDMAATDGLEIEWKLQLGGKKREIGVWRDEATWSAFCGWGSDWIFAALNWVVAVCQCGSRKHC
jgi:hypothetical protein